jgi:hypothetical protein
MDKLLYNLQDLLAEYQRLHENNENKKVTLQIQLEILKQENIDYDLKIKALVDQLNEVMTEVMLQDA